MKVLSVVCARAGSKGLRNKCIAKIRDKMVVEYSIEYSLSLGDNVKTVVSTDIEEIIDHCEKRNIAYIRRGPRLCTDDSKIDDALADAIEKDDLNCKYCSLLYGNVPLRFPKLFHEALGFLEDNADFDAVISMQNVEKYHPLWMFDYSEKMLPKVKDSHHRRQMLPQKMIHDGHTLIFKSENFYKRYKGIMKYDKDYRYSIFGNKIRPMVNDKLIIDVDTEKDLELAEVILFNRI
ncbi:MAG: hypothetical protein JSV09_07290 [Thermoplasmata archaeon]|nr:MAG: hypothetical protein JSV09_07290 [Thermoplasmata archaeon]